MLKEVETRQVVFKEVRLQPWQEVVGTLKEIKVEGDHTTAILRCTRQVYFVISYLNGTKEAEILQTLDDLLGKKVAILRTDIPENPILARTVGKTK
jgi:hypothetical protein